MRESSCVVLNIIFQGERCVNQWLHFSVEYYKSDSNRIFTAQSCELTCALSHTKTICTSFTTPKHPNMLLFIKKKCTGKDTCQLLTTDAYCFYILDNTFIMGVLMCVANHFPTSCNRTAFLEEEKRKQTPAGQMCEIQTGADRNDGKNQAPVYFLKAYRWQAAVRKGHRCTDVWW